MTNFLVTLSPFDFSPSILIPTVFLNLSLTTPLLKAVGPGEEELAACEFLYNVTPEMYKEERLTFELTPAEASRYRLLLRSVDDALCEFRTLANSFLTFLDPTEAPYPLLPLLAPIVGIDFNFDVPEDVARREILNAIFLWERKGTRDNFKDWVEFITGFRVRIREFYKEVFRTNVWGQAYHNEKAPTTLPVVWRESWDTFLPVPSYSRSRKIPPLIWEEDWERIVAGDPYATLPHLDEHHALNTWDGTEVVRPFYNFHFSPDINYGIHGFTQIRKASPDNGVVLPGFLFRNHQGVYLDIPDSDFVDTIDSINTSKPLTTNTRINNISIESGLRVLFLALDGGEEDDNGIIWDAQVDIGGNVSWSPHVTTAAEAGIDFLWFDNPFLDIIIRKVSRILDLITLFGVVNHLFFRLVDEENAYLCHQYEYTVVPRLLEGWGNNIGDDVEIFPESVHIIQTTNCDAVSEETFSCFGDTYNIDIGNTVCCPPPDGCEGRLATFALCLNDPERTTNNIVHPWLLFYPAKYWSHQVDDILQEWTPDTSGTLTSEVTIPAEYSLAEVFIDPFIGTGTGQGVESTTEVSNFIIDTCVNGVFDVLVIREEWNNPFIETLVINDNWNYNITINENLVINDNWNYNITINENLVINDNWNLPPFGGTLVINDNWNYSIIINEDLIITDNWNYSDTFDESLVITDDWNFSFTPDEDDLDPLGTILFKSFHL